MLLPIKSANQSIDWKIWVLSTILENLDLQKENETLLQSPGRQLDGTEDVETDVFIIGGGNAYEDHKFRRRASLTCNLTVLSPFLRVSRPWESIV